MEDKSQEYDVAGRWEGDGQGSDPHASILYSSLRHISKVDGSEDRGDHVEGEQPSKRIHTVYLELQRGAAEDVCKPQQATAHVSSRLLLSHPLFRLLLGALVSVLLIAVPVVVVLSFQSLQQTRGEEERPCNSSKQDLHLNIADEFRHLKESLKHLQEEICSPQEQMKCKLCPQNWVYNEGKCYYISEEEAPWDESRRHCTSRRSELAVIETEGGKEFLVNQLPKAVFWIGLRNENGTWRWVTGSNFTDKINGGGDDKRSCGTMNGGRVGSESCKNPNKWTCEKNATDFPPASELYN